MTEQEKPRTEPQLWFGDSHTLDMPSDEDFKSLSENVSVETPRTPRL